MESSNDRLRKARENAGFASARSAATRFGWVPSTYASHENGQTAVPLKAAEKYAKAFKTTASYILGISDSDVAPDLPLTVESPPSQSERRGDSNARIIGPSGNFGRVPLRGRAMGGDEGFLIVDTEVFGYVDAPERVAGVPDAYAVYVVGDSMLERFRRGEIVYVDPHRPPVAGDDVVIQISEDGGTTVKGYIKRLVSRDGKLLKVRQLNPPATLTFPDKHVVSVHMIVLAGKA